MDPFRERPTHCLCRFSLWCWLTKPDKRQKWWGCILISWILFPLLLFYLWVQFDLDSCERDVLSHTLTNEGERIGLEERFSSSSSIILWLLYWLQSTFTFIISLNHYNNSVAKLLLNLILVKEKKMWLGYLSFCRFSSINQWITSIKLILNKRIICSISIHKYRVMDLEALQYLIYLM